MNRRTVVASVIASAFTLGGCGDDDAARFDACDEMTATPTTPALDCPAEVVLDCVPPEGTAADFDVRADVCEGAAPTVSCSPETGATLRAGEHMVLCSATAETGEEATCAFRVRATPAGMPSLVCPVDVAATCASPLTAVALGEATADTTCGAIVGAIANDAPVGGFPAGITPVTFSATAEDGSAIECTTTVTVRDPSPPTLECEPSRVYVRTSPDDPMAPPAPTTLSDDCDDDPELTVEPAMLVRGMNTVVYTARDDAGQSSECTSTIDMRDAFTPEGFRIISATLASDGTTDVTVAWDAGGGADVTGYAIERGPAMDGPWTRLRSVGRGSRTYTDDTLTDRHAFYRVVALATDVDGGATPGLRAHSIAAATYDLRGQSVPTVPFSTTLYGVVRHPTDLGAGPYPLVVLLHGNHGICRRTPTSTSDVCATSTDHECPTAGFVTTPNAEGLAYLAESVAAQGYIAVSISANAINCRMTWILERAQLVLEHLRRWRAWNGGGSAPFGRTFVGAVDLNRVALFGHSRGGEAVAHVPALLRISGVRLSSVFSLAPTDYDDPAPTGVPYAVLLPGCDGDVRFLFGTDIYDRSILGTDDEPRAQVLFDGANHNFFNTEWRENDNAGGVACARSSEVGGPAQRGMLEGVLGAWLAGTTGAGPLEPFVRADDGVPQGIDAWADTSLDLRWSYAARRLRIDELEGAGTPATNLLGQANTFVQFETAAQCYDNACGTRYPHEKGAMRLRWDQMRPTATWGLGGLDASGYGYLSFRVVSRRSTFNSAIAEQVFTIRAVDSAGISAEVRSDAFVRVPHLYANRDPLEIFQTVRVPLSAFATTTPGFDATSLDRAELEMRVRGNRRGSMMVTDVAVGD